MEDFQDMRYKHLRLLVSMFCLFFVLPTALKADIHDRKTILTFSGAVEIPGHVLVKGTYVFKLYNSPSDRSIVQIFNESQDHVYATVLAMPSYRENPPDKTDVTFWERAENSPQAVKSWFYPGGVYGLEFVYPKWQAAKISMRNNAPVLALDTDVPGTVSSLEKAAVIVVAPNQKEVPVALAQPKLRLAALNEGTQKE
jgi:hypothetical protein